MWIIGIIVLLFFVFIMINNSKSEINYRQFEKKRENDYLTAQWLVFKKNTTDNKDELMEIFIEEFFIIDRIDVVKFMGNLDLILNPWKKNIDETGTPSIILIEYIPPGFFRYFIAGYPDVYIWLQKEWDSGNIIALERMKKQSKEEYDKEFNDPRKRLEFYRAIINQYKREGKLLECSE